jgi:hypothetical protein
MIAGFVCNYLSFCECDDVGRKSLHRGSALASNGADALVLAPWVPEVEFAMTWLPFGENCLRFLE